jgi:hypothetical protein
MNTEKEPEDIMPSVGNQPRLAAALGVSPVLPVSVFPSVRGQSAIQSGLAECLLCAV